MLLVAIHLEDNWSLERKELIGKVFEKILEYGADPSLRLSANPHRERNLEMRVRTGKKVLAYYRRSPFLPSPLLFTKVGGITF